MYIRDTDIGHFEIELASDMGKGGYKGGDKGDSPPPEPFQGGDCPPPENCPPPERFRGGTAKILENVPLLSDSGGGQIFSFRYFHVNSS